MNVGKWQSRPGAIELVSNAAKHGDGDIELNLSVADGVARLEIRDHGHGFPDGFEPAKSANTAGADRQPQLLDGPDSSVSKQS